MRSELTILVITFASFIIQEVLPYLFNRYKKSKLSDKVVNIVNKHGDYTTQKLVEDEIKTTDVKIDERKFDGAWSVIKYCISMACIFIIISSSYFVYRQFSEARREKIIREALTEEKIRKDQLDNELYVNQQYQILEYRVGTCEFTESNDCPEGQDLDFKVEIPSCQARTRISTQVLESVLIKVETKIRKIKDENTSEFEYVALQDENGIVYDEQNNPKIKVFNQDASVEQRLEPATLDLIRPKEWFCLPPGTYQEQTTINYTYSNASGSKLKTPVFLSEPFTII